MINFDLYMEQKKTEHIEENLTKKEKEKIQNNIIELYKKGKTIILYNKENKNVNSIIEIMEI